MKRTIPAILTVLCILLSGSVFAADNPAYLYYYEKTDLENVKEPIDPWPPAKTAIIPIGVSRCSFSFENKDVQYSDYHIQTAGNDCDMVVYYRALPKKEGAAKEYDLKITLVKLKDEEELYTKKISLTTAWQKIYIDRKYSPTSWCYLKLTEPSVDGKEAAGEIMVAGTRGPRTEITLSRGEFAMLLAELLELDTDDADGAEEFGDVGEHNYPYGAVMRLRELGIVKGVGNNTFDYQSKITYAQAFCMAARLFAAEGEIEDASPDRPYPIGGTVICSELGLSKGISVNLDDEVTQAGCKLLFDNIREIYDDIKIFGSAQE